MNKIQMRLRALILTVVTIFAVASCDADDDKPIDFNDLPKTAQNFVNTNFQSLTVSSVTKDKGLDKEYKVFFSDGTMVEFDRKGNWSDVKCMQGVPAEIVPQQIKEKIAKDYPEQKIVEIEKGDRGGYDIKLDNGLEIEFNKDFKITEIDR